MRIGAAQQRFAARMFELRGLAVRFFQFVDRFQGMVGGRYGLDTLPCPWKKAEQSKPLYLSENPNP